MMAESGEDDVDRQVQIMTTMHFALSAERASTVTEAVGRAAMYLMTVSMTLVALGFIASATRMGRAFYVLAFVLLFCLTFLGFISVLRIVQTAVEDICDATRLAFGNSTHRRRQALRSGLEQQITKASGAS